ncbi:MAG TPA: dipeptidase [Gemmatimonadaceae bacterium]|nr:dipeptidase [Gemmatimonadaceae bacterium]
MRLPALLLVFATAACASSGAPRPITISDGDALARARALHERIITIDTHDDIPLNFATAAVDPLNANRQVNLEKMRAGGLDVGFFIVYVGQTPRTPENYDRAKTDAQTKFSAIHRMVQMYPDRIGLARSPDDVVRLAREGKLAAAIGIENGYVIGKDLALVARYHSLGARYMTLAHGRHNDICDSATDQNPPEHSGMSAFGRQVVAEMNRVGMMVDISHVSRDCMMQATAASKLPVIASHSSAKAVADHPRNLDDEQLRAIRQNGGVAQMVAFARYVKVGATEPPATVADFVNHIDHAVRVAGIDHVGISSDFDGGGGVVGWRDASETMNVTAELIRRGYSDAQIEKLWSGNTLRVWRANEQGATAAP